MADKTDKYSFIVVKYPQKDTADAALKAVLGLAKEKVVKLRDEFYSPLHSGASNMASRHPLPARLKRRPI